uniref:Integrase catalytic domain-containing protein n=1 Tax=Strongyloides stercoralis TaxID=6248 RepID=A0A0K0EA41_STRER
MFNEEIKAKKLWMYADFVGIPMKANTCHMRKAFDLVKAYFNFPVQRFKEIYSTIVNNCLPCQTSVPRSEPAIPEKLVACGILRYSYTVDLCGPLIKAPSTTGHRYLKLAIDTATRFMMYSTTNDTPSKVVATIAKDQILFPYEKPTVLKLDNAKYFRELEFSEIIQKEGVLLRYGTPYLHNSQSLVERAF